MNDSLFATGCLCAIVSAACLVVAGAHWLFDDIPHPVTPWMAAIGVVLALMAVWIWMTGTRSGPAKKS